MGNLVLGDFGLVFFSDNSKTRLSATLENVGSRDWMPQWTMGMRIDELKPTFDVFALGKVLWSMLSGRSFLRLWYYDLSEFDLEGQFPDCAPMKLVNQLLSKCVVEHERDCLSDANALLAEVDESLSFLHSPGEVLSKSSRRLCRVCGRGNYELKVDGSQQGSWTKLGNFGYGVRGNQTGHLFICSYCGHNQLFSFPIDEEPSAWRNTNLPG